jgi:hypothetical protein
MDYIRHQAGDGHVIKLPRYRPSRERGTILCLWVMDHDGDVGYGLHNRAAHGMLCDEGNTESYADWGVGNGLHKRAAHRDRRDKGSTGDPNKGRGQPG